MKIIWNNFDVVWIFCSFNDIFISSYSFKMFWKLIGLLSSYHNIIKRPRVGQMLEQLARRQTEVEDPQVGSRVIEALWALNAWLGKIQAELVASQEATSESVWLLCRSVIYNLRRIEMTLAVQRDRSWEEGELEFCCYNLYFYLV